MESESRRGQERKDTVLEQNSGEVKGEKDRRKRESSGGKEVFSWCLRAVSGNSCSALRVLT